MTGFGKAEDIFRSKKYSIEIRSLNSRFSEISVKSPKYLYTREFELKEIIRKKISRGKIGIVISRENNDENGSGLSVNDSTLKEYVNILKSVRKKINSKEKIKLEHILKFSDLLMKEPDSDVDDEEFNFVSGLLLKAFDDLTEMKKKEGKFLQDDILSRLDFIERENDAIIELGKKRINTEKQIYTDKVNSLLQDRSLIDEKRLEFEISFLVEKMDITEECVRLKSHLEYFRNSALSKDDAGRRLNFLLQEMNREVNTIASKASDAGISQKVSVLKEELEKIREQIQNVE